MISSVNAEWLGKCLDELILFYREQLQIERGDLEKDLQDFKRKLEECDE